MKKTKRSRLVSLIHMQKNKAALALAKIARTSGLDTITTAMLEKLA